MTEQHHENHEGETQEGQIQGEKHKHGPKADQAHALTSVANKETKEALKLVFAFLKVLKEAKNNDGQITVADLPLLVQVFPHIEPAITDIDKVAGELKGLTPERVKDLLVFTSANLAGLVSKADEELVEKALKAALAVVDLVGHVIKDDN